MTVAIKEGSKSRQFGNTDYLRTKLVGGGTCDWVREDARQLTKKKVKKDGTYKASDEHDKYGNSYFAFSSFTVAVKKKSITGKRKDPEHPDDPSYDYEVEVAEDENGELVETGLPHHIKITKNPNKLTYNDGDTIEKTGMVVKAYNKDGSLWTHEGYTGGVIPLSEITLEPKKAKAPDYDAYTDGHGVFCRRFVCTKYTDEVDGGAYYDPNPLRKMGEANICIASRSPATIFYATIYNGYLYIAGNHNTFEIDDKNWYAHNIYTESDEILRAFEEEGEQVPVSSANPNEVAVENLVKEGTWEQDVSSIWKRYGDGKQLTDTYTIEVSTTDNGAGGGGGGAW